MGLLAIGSLPAARFFIANQLPDESRRLLLVLAASAAVAALLAVGLAWRRRPAAEPLVAAAHRLSPLLLAACVPALFNWRAWEGRDVHFLTLVAVTSLGAERLWRLRLASPPIGWSRRLADGAAGRLLAGATPRRAAALAVCFAAAAYAAYFAYHTIAFHRNLHTRSFDLGLEANAVWNAWHGGPLLKSSPFAGPDGSLLGYHAVWWSYALGLPYAIHPHPETLLALQAILLGAAGIFLFLWSRRHLGDGRAAVVAASYWLYAPLHGSNLYDFHYQTLAPFCLWLTLWAAETRRDALAAAAVVATIALREDVAASVVVIGAYLFVSGLRPRAGMAVAAAAALYFVAMKFLVMPAAEPNPSFLYAFSGLLPAGQASFEAVLRTIAGNPVFTLGTLLTPAKLVYVLQVFVPLAFLPLRRALGWLFLLPGFFFTLLSTGYAPFNQISFQYTAHWTGFLFPAVVLSLARLGRTPPSTDRVRAALIALSLASLACSFQYGAVLQRNTARSGFDPFTFGTTPADRQRRAELDALIRRIPPLAKVASSETVVPHVADRPDAYTLRLGVYDAEYLLFCLVPTAEGELEPAARALDGGEFGVVETRSLFVLARRGHETSGNASVLARIAPYRPLPR